MKWEKPNQVIEIDKDEIVIFKLKNKTLLYGIGLFGTIDYQGEDHFTSNEVEYFLVLPPIPSEAEDASQNQPGGLFLI